MGFMGKLFSKESTEKEESYTEAPPCPHGVLTPRWDSVEDIGKEDRATAYICEACHQSFSPDEYRELQASMAERLPVETPSETPSETTS